MACAGASAAPSPVVGPSRDALFGTSPPCGEPASASRDTAEGCGADSGKGGRSQASIWYSVPLSAAAAFLMPTLLIAGSGEEAVDGGVAAVSITCCFVPRVGRTWSALVEAAQRGAGAIQVNLEKETHGTKIIHCICDVINVNDEKIAE